MKVASESEVAADFAEYVKAAKAGPVVVTSRGKPVAVLLRARDEDEVERLLLGHSPALRSILEAARKRFRAVRGIPHGQFWDEFEAQNAGGRPRRGRAAKNGRTNGSS